MAKHQVLIISLQHMQYFSFVKTGLQNGFYACINSHIESGPGSTDQLVLPKFTDYSGDKTIRSTLGFCAEVFWRNIPGLFGECTDKLYPKNR
jgi:hypothetical protein